MPSWFPTDRASWPDYVSFYQNALNLISSKLNVLHTEDTIDHTLNQIKGEIVAEVIEKSVQWLLDSFMPKFDDNALYLEHWENVLSLQKRASTAERQEAITAALRLLGKNATKEVLQLIFSVVLGCTPEEIEVDWTTKDEFDANLYTPENITQLDLMSCQFAVYNINGDTSTFEIDVPLCEALVNRIRAAGYNLFVGPRLLAYCDNDYMCDMCCCTDDPLP